SGLPLSFGLPRQRDRDDQASSASRPARPFRAAAELRCAPCDAVDSLAAGWETCGIETASVVVNRYFGPSLHDFEGDPGVSRPRVAHDVVDRLLEDEEQRPAHFQRRGASALQTGSLERDFNARAPECVFRETTEAVHQRIEAIVTGTDGPDNVAHLRHGVASDCGDFLQKGCGQVT